MLLLILLIAVIPKNRRHAQELQSQPLLLLIELPLVLRARLDLGWLESCMLLPPKKGRNSSKNDVKDFIRSDICFVVSCTDIDTEELNKEAE